MCLCQLLVWLWLHPSQNPFVWYHSVLAQVIVSTFSHSLRVLHQYSADCAWHIKCSTARASITRYMTDKANFNEYSFLADAWLLTNKAAGKEVVDV